MATALAEWRNLVNSAEKNADGRPAFGRSSTGVGKGETHGCKHRNLAKDSCSVPRYVFSFLSIQATTTHPTQPPWRGWKFVFWRNKTMNTHIWRQQTELRQGWSIRAENRSIKRQPPLSPLALPCSLNISSLTYVCTTPKHRDYCEEETGCSLGRDFRSWLEEISQQKGHLVAKPFYREAYYKALCPLGDLDCVFNHVILNFLIHKCE